MRRLSLVFLVALLAACGGNSPAGPPKSDGDPYWYAGSIFQPGLYPDSARYFSVATVVNHVGTDSAYSATYVQEDSYITASHVCFSPTMGSGVLTDPYTMTIDWYITINNKADTIGRYTTGAFLPLQSPIPGLGDDPQHSLLWFVSVDSLTPRAPALVVLTPVQGYPWPPEGNAHFCRP